MKRLLLILLCFLYTVGSASIVTPTDITIDGLVDIQDDDWGEIGFEFEPKVYLSILKEPEFIGDEVILIATLVDFKPTDVITFLWEYAIEPPDWNVIENENKRTYRFILDEINAYYYYRVSAKVEGEK